LGELYGVSATVLGNERLVAEDGVSFDLGVTSEGRAGPLTFWGQALGFARLSWDLVAYRRSSFGAIRPFNADRSRTLGAEVAVGLTAWRALDAGLSMTLLDPRDTSDGGPARNLIPYLSRLVLAPTIGLTSPPWETVALDAATLRLRYLHRSSRVADPAGLILLSEQNLLDLDATLAFAEMVLVRARIANLIDQRTVDLVGYPLPGRSYHAMVEGQF
jgi:iron complex outermembrane receptor protein